jgi:hypothetical protein
MKNVLLLSFLLAAAAAPTLPAHSQTANPLFRLIPPDADIVYHLNLPAITAKMSLAAMINTVDLTKIHHAPTRPELDQLLAIFDTTKDFIIVRSNVFHKDSLGYTTVLAHLIDSGRFVAFLHKNLPELDYHPSNGAYRVATSAQFAYAWNDKLVVLLGIRQKKGATPDEIRTAPPVFVDRCMAALKGFDHSFFTTDPTFLAAFSDDADAHFWNRSGTGYGGLTTLMDISGARRQFGDLNQLLGSPGGSHSSAIGSLRLETGKISYHLIRIMSPNDSARTMKFFASPLNPSLLADIPRDKLIGLLALHLDLPSIKEALEAHNRSANIDGDITRAFTGDVQLLVYDPPSPELLPGRSPKSPLIFIVAAIGDKTEFQKVTKGLKLYGPADTVSRDSSRLRLYYKLVNDAAIIGFTPQAIDYYTHAGRTQDPARPADRLITEGLRTKSLAMTIDFPNLRAWLETITPKGGSPGNKDRMVFDLLAQFDGFLFTSGVLHGHLADSWCELKLTDPRQKSLPLMVDLLNRMLR